MLSPEQVAFVLVRTKNAGNIGAAARALRNMGFADLRLVAPRADADRVASELAAHGRELLAQSPRYQTLDEALHDRTLAIGTTCRGGAYRSGVTPVREAAAELTQDNSRERIALVFGPEDHGLSNDELASCQRLVIIPTTPDYPSLNLAQAVMVVAWELFMSRQETRVSTQGDVPVLAPLSTVEAMLRRLEHALIEIGFLSETNPDHIMFALRVLLGRAGLSPRDVDILNGIARQIGWFAEAGRDIIKDKRQSGRKIR
jgi:TrmH family RNA methyltransferase